MVWYGKRRTSLSCSIIVLVQLVLEKLVLILLQLCLQQNQVQAGPRRSRAHPSHVDGYCLPAHLLVQLVSQTLTLPVQQKNTNILTSKNIGSHLLQVQPNTFKSSLQPLQKETGFYRLKNSGIKSAALFVIPGFNQDFIPEGSAIPEPLSTLFSMDHTSLSRTEMIQLAIQVYNTTNISQQQVCNSLK